MSRDRALSLLSWLGPFFVCLYVYWPGVNSWFQQDDFAWLGLGLEIYSPKDLLRALFEPRAQGTIRPLSERAFFMGLFALFGLDALPYRMMVFATQMLNLALLSTLAFRLTGSRAAGMLAALFWGVNASLGVPLSWTSSYNQVLCTSFLLGALVLFQRYLETGERKYYYGQLAVFLAGFGALEMNIVYPALAAGLALATFRRHVWKTIPMFGISGAYYLMHNHFARKPQAGPYAMHFDGALPATLWHYWQRAFGGPMLVDLDMPAWFQQVGATVPWVLSGVLLVFVVYQARSGKRVALFLPAWFMVVIGPVLPLRDHISYYYLTMPTIGLAILGGWAAWRGFVSGWASRIGTVALVGLYVSTSAMAGRGVAEFHYERTQKARRLVLGVARIHELHPEKMILLHGVGTELYWSTINDNPFRLIGFDDVHLTPGSEETIQAHPELGDVSQFVFPSGATLRALDQKKAVVYSAGGDTLRNITQSYERIARSHLKPGLSKRVNVGHPSFAEQLGDGWEKIESGYRWMRPRAEVLLGGPVAAGEKLYLSGFVPGLLVKKGPVHMRVTVEDRALPESRLVEGDSAFEVVHGLDPGFVGRERVQVVITVEPAYQEPDGRALGLVFGQIGIR